MKLKKLAQIMLLSSVLIAPMQNARASGIPVIDSAGLVQHVSSFVQQLTDYSEMLVHTGLEQSQLAQMITDYNQMLIEYDHLINRIEGLQANISPDQWAALVQEIAKTYGSEDFGLTATLDPATANYTHDIRRLLKDVGLAPKTSAEVVAEYNALGANTTVVASNLDHVNRVYSKYQNQHEMVANNTKQVDALSDRKKVNSLMLESLGNETDLQTLQFIAAQQQFTQEHLQLLATVQNQQLSAYEPPSLKRAQEKAELVDAERRRIEAVQAKPVARAGEDSWADLL